MSIKLEVSDEGSSFDRELERICGIIRTCRIGIIPSDTVYGVAALAESSSAIERLSKIKERPPDKPFPIQVADFAQARALGIFESWESVELARAFWPGGLTIVVPAREELDFPYQGKTIGLRVPDFSFCREIIRRAGPIVLPSANKAGLPSPSSFEEIAPEIINAVDFSVDMGRCRVGIESTVVSVAGEFKILREGAISEEEIRGILGERKR